MQIKHRTQLHEILKQRGLTGLPVAEVGVAEGRFSQEILAWEVNIPLLYMIDAWQTLDTTGDGSSPQEWHDANYQQAKDGVAKFGERALLLKGLSTEMANQIADNSLGMVYLDAGHDYRNVLADLEAFYPKVVSGGIIAGHDYLCSDYDVERAVNDFAKGRFEINVIPETNVNDAGFWFVKM